MDPNTLLKEIILHANEVTNTPNVNATCLMLAYEIIHLHNWLKNGGFLPNEWKHPETS